MKFKYKCMKCKKIFKIKRWSDYIMGIFNTLGASLYKPYYLCDKCFNKEDEKWQKIKR